MESRPDFALIRHLSRVHSPALGVEYGRLPLFLVPEDLSVLTDQEQELLATVGEGENQLHLLFPDLLLDFPSGSWSAMRALFAEWPDRGRLWVRVRTVEKALHTQDAMVFTPREDLAKIPNPDLWALAEAWEEKTNVGGSFHKYPDISVFPLGAEAGRFETYLHNYPNPWHQEGRLLGQFCNLLRCTLPQNDRRREGCVFSDLLMSAVVQLSLLALCYLTTGVSLTVHVRSEKPQAVKPHMAKEKPWLMPRAHYILVDPARMREYGHPSGGMHRSPTPHPRRGQ